MRGSVVEVISVGGQPDGRIPGEVDVVGDRTWKVVFGTVYAIHGCLFEAISDSDRMAAA